MEVLYISLHLIFSLETFLNAQYHSDLVSLKTSLNVSSLFSHLFKKHINIHMPDTITETNHAKTNRHCGNDKCVNEVEAEVEWHW